MDTHSMPPRKDFYESEYATQFIEHQSELERGGIEDQTIWKLLKEVRRGNESSETTHNDRTFILDLGTGTGRALFSLADFARKEGTDLSNLNLIGLDASQEMLLRAQDRNSQLEGVESIQWLVGDAANLLDQPSLNALRHKIDLIILSENFLALLHKPGDAEKLLSHIGQLLNPENGRVFMSIFNHLLLKENEEAQIPKYLEEGINEMDTLNESSSLPFKVRTVSLNGNVEDGIFSENWEANIVETDEKGNEIVLEIIEDKSKQRVWKIEELLQKAKASGLGNLEVEKTDILSLLTFKHSGQS